MNVEVLAPWSLSRRDAAAEGREQRAKTGTAIQVERAKKKVARRKGLELGERLRLVVVAEPFGWVRVGLRPPAGSDETRRLFVTTKPEGRHRKAPQRFDAGMAIQVGKVKKKVARRKGLEPPTFWSVARCSIQLSYRRSTREAHCATRDLTVQDFEFRISNFGLVTAKCEARSRICRPSVRFRIRCPGTSMESFAISFSVTLLPSIFSDSSVRVAATRTEESELEHRPGWRVVCSDT